jgi:hypothetical protein
MKLFIAAIAVILLSLNVANAAAKPVKQKLQPNATNTTVAKPGFGHFGGYHFGAGFGGHHFGTTHK